MSPQPTPKPPLHLSSAPAETPSAQDLSARPLPDVPRPFDWNRAEMEIATAADIEDQVEVLRLALNARDALQHESHPRYPEMCSAIRIAAETCEALGRHEQAIDLWREGCAVAENENVSEPTTAPDFIVDLSLALLKHSKGKDAADFAEANSLLNSALPRYAAIYSCSPGDFPHLQSEAREMQIQNAKVGAVTALNSFARTCIDIGRVTQGERLAQRGSALCDKILGSTSDLAFSLRWTAMEAAREREHFQREESIARRSLGCLSDPASATDAQTLLLQSRLANILVRQKKFDQAQVLAASLVARIDPLMLDDTGRSAVPHLFEALADIATHKGDSAQAKAHLSRAIDFEQSHAAGSWQYLTSLTTLLAHACERNAQTALKEGNQELFQLEESEAKSAYLDAVALCEQESAGATFNGLQAHQNLFEFYYEREHFLEAHQAAVDLQRLVALLHGPDSEDHVEAMLMRAELEVKLKDYGRAEATMLKALEIAKRLPVLQQDRVVSDYSELSRVAKLSEAHESALQYLEDAVEFAAQLRGRSSALFAEATLSLAEELIHSGDITRAERATRDVMQEFEGKTVTRLLARTLARCCHTIGYCCANDGENIRLDDARNWYSRADSYFKNARGAAEFYLDFLLDSGKLHRESFERDRKPSDLHHALHCLQTAETLAQRHNLLSDKAHLNLLEQIAGLLETDGNYQTARVYEERADNLRYNLAENGEEEQSY